MDGRLLADYVAQRTKRFGGDLSLVELEDRHIPGEQNVTPDILGALHSLPVKYLPLGSNAEKAFLDTSSWAAKRTEQPSGISGTLFHHPWKSKESLIIVKAQGCSSYDSGHGSRLKSCRLDEVP
jgi:hypothetical protein